MAARAGATREPPERLREEAPSSGAPLHGEEGVAAFLDALERGEPWYAALLDVVARWVDAEELIDGINYRYLLAGEAFDWLLLAQRLLDAAGSRVPADEVERLLFQRRAPEGERDTDFARAIGPHKYRAHLNFEYGVVVEEVLLLAAEMELHKARPVEGPRGEPADIQAYERVYGKPLQELLQLYRAESGCMAIDRVSQSDMQGFTYWCSKYRFRTGEPARVASDTRKALALLSRMESEARRPTVSVPEADDVLDLEVERGDGR